MLDRLIRSRTMGKLCLFLFVLLMPSLTSCARVEVSLNGDNVARPPYIFNPEEVPATPLCPLTPFASPKQNTGVWCWAASAQMVINYLGNPLSQCEIVSKTLDHQIPSNPPGCCMAEDSFVPDPPPPPDDVLYNEQVADARTKCLKRYWPSKALRAYQYNVEETSDPIDWPGLTDQLCTKRTPYIFVVSFYDNGIYAGRHTSVVGGARVTSDGDRYVEISDHSEDDFFLMKWGAFAAGVPGDFKHEFDFINIKQP